MKTIVFPSHFRTGNDGIEYVFRLRLRKCPRVFLLLLAHRVQFVRITAGIGSIGSHRTLGGDHRNYASPWLAFQLFSPSSNQGGTGKQRSFFQ
jgi:hypothetical protein